MVDKSRITLQKLARWHPAQSNPTGDRKGSAALWEGTLQPLEHEDLKQGALYIIKIHKVSVGLFQGWNDDMCCFAVLRSENAHLPWSQARYLPGDFDVFDAFDEAGNPPVHLWTRYLRADVPVNWFVIFEEARRKQREWTILISGQQHQQEQQQRQHQQEQEQRQHQHQQQQQQQLHHDDPPSIGANTGIKPGMVIVGHPHHQLEQQSYEEYSDLDTFSAAPSQSLRSERISNISSLRLPSEARPEDITDMAPPPTSLSNTNTRPHSPTATNIPSPSSSPQPQSNFYETNQPHLSHTPLQPYSASSVRHMAARSNETNHQISRLQLHTTSSLPDTTTKTQIPSPSPTTLSNQQPIMKSPISPSSSAPNRLGVTLDELSFPHDDDQFSIHSDFQPNVDSPESKTIDDQYSTKSSNSNTTLKNQSIKKMLSRSPNIAK